MLSVFGLLRRESFMQRPKIRKGRALPLREWSQTINMYASRRARLPVLRFVLKVSIPASPNTAYYAGGVYQHALQ